MARTAARPATTWGPAVLNMYSLYMVGTSVRANLVLQMIGFAVASYSVLYSVLSALPLCAILKMIDAYYKDTMPAEG